MVGSIVHPPIGSIYHLYTTYSPCLLGGPICYRSHLLGEPETSLDQVSKNRGTTKSSILIRFSIINHPFRGTVPLFLETTIYNSNIYHQWESDESLRLQVKVWALRTYKTWNPRPVVAETNVEARCDTRKRDMGVEPKIGGKPPKWMVKIMENLIKMDDLGVPLFLETPI